VERVARRSVACLDCSLRLHNRSLYTKLQQPVPGVVLLRIASRASSLDGRREA
jgi:hypothetical protein